MTVSLLPKGLERPVGVNIIGSLQVIGGGVGLGMLVLLGYVAVFYETPPMAALAVLLPLCALLLALSAALIVCGRAMQAGARWAWYLASTMYMSGIVADMALIATLPSGRSYHYGPLAISLLLYGYMTTGRVRAFFGLVDRVGLKTYLTELGIAAALALVTVPMGHRAEVLRYERERRTEILALLEQGNSHMAEHDYDDAIDDFTKAIELHPDLAVAYNNRGMAYAMKRDIDRAMDDFERALELDPDGAAGGRARRALRLLEGR
ncbi:MAG: tetratricopeptide repeat protein [Planctomycetota bacterium]